MAKLGTEKRPAIFHVNSMDRVEGIASICEKKRLEVYHRHRAG